MMMKTRVKKWQWKWNLTWTWTGTWTWTSKWLEHKPENENGHGHENEHEMKMNMKMKIWKWKWGWGWNWKWKWKWGWGWKWKEWKWNWTCIFFGRNPSQVLLKNMWRNWLDCYKLWACMATGMLARQEKQQRFNSAIRFWGVRGNVLLSFWNTWTWNQLNMILWMQTLEEFVVAVRETMFANCAWAANWTRAKLSATDSSVPWLCFSSPHWTVVDCSYNRKIWKTQCTKFSRMWMWGTLRTHAYFFAIWFTSKSSWSHGKVSRSWARR